MIASRRRVELGRELLDVLVRADTASNLCVRQKARDLPPLLAILHHVELNAGADDAPEGFLQAFDVVARFPAEHLGQVLHRDRMASLGQ